MTRWQRLGLVGLSALAAGGAIAAVAADYAWQWALAPQAGDSGAYRVVLDASVYGALQSRSLRDLDVVDAGGATVPAAVLPAMSPAASIGERVPMRWFPLPSGPRDAGNDIALQVERDADGTVRRVETRLSGARAAQARPTEAWLVDASAVDGIVALWLEWAPGQTPLDVAYRVEGSNDLRDWRMLQPRAPLVDLVRDGERLQQRRIPLQGSARYLRLLPSDGSGTLQLSSVQAELAPAVADVAWQWQALDGAAIDDRGTTHYEYTLDGRFPIERVDLQLPGNSAGEWTLYSRDEATTPWVRRTGPWVSFRIGERGADRSAPQVLSSAVRDRHWRLSGSVPSAQVPQLRLGWQPETVVFVAQGTPPYTLVAGSARAARANAPMPQLLEAIRRQHGVDWQPAVATLGERQQAAGERALVPVEEPRDWKAWLLWALLVGGALLVGTFAISLLRGKPAS
ncbi:DUF3999 domain-containing protein [Luteimonas aestuarii]|uniref:DUF3999 domain-containing protein n=1 Tax=Luteimonas aestuarii TaxID=453837 RepID=A0A4R5U0Z5_9GAMM|nr:DUF3999 domain-containing protein [Luteimonas aestuarii]TDK27231.1 DUF3999 domain-containing protein [Luteimonas aestuarii]